MKEYNRKETKTMAQVTRRAWKLQEFPAHAANVNSVSLGHKSGRVLVTGGGDKKVNLWAVGKPNCVMSLSGHSTPVDCVQFSITEEHVCAGSQAGALKIWDLESARILRTLTGHRAGIKCVDFHPYGDLLASGSSDSAIKMWDIRKKGCIFGYKGHSSTVNSLKFSPDGQWIASGGDDNLVKIWDIRKGKVLFEFGDHNAPVTGVDFHPTHFLLASGSVDRTVKFYDLETFTLVSSSLSDVPSVRCILFHPNGSCLFAASPEVLRVHGWDPPETYDTVPTTWSKIQDIAISQDHMIGVSTQMTNVSVFVADLRRIQPIGDKSARTAMSAGQSLRKTYTMEHSRELVESLDAMKASEESDSLPTDPEDDFQHEIKIPANFKQVFFPQRDLTRTPPPAPEEYSPPDDEPSSHSTDAETDPKSSPDFKYVTRRSESRRIRVSKDKAVDTSPRRSSVPAVHSHSQNLSAYNNSGVRSHSPEYLSSSRQSSSSEDSSGPHSSRSADNYRLHPSELISSHSSSRQDPVRPSVEPSNVRSVRRSEGTFGSQTSFPSVTPPFHTLPRSPERPLAQCQVKPMPKILAPPSPGGDENDPFIKTEFSKSHDDFVPIPLDKPSGLAIDDFLPLQCHSQESRHYQYCRCSAQLHYNSMMAFRGVSQKGKPTLSFEGFVYTLKNTKICGTVVWRCSKRGCTGRAESFNGDNSQTKDHSCDGPSAIEVARRQIMASMKNRAIEDETEPPSRVMDAAHKNLPKKSPVAFGGGVHVVDINESDVFSTLLREHQPLLTVLLARQRNLRIIYNIWQTKDVKTAVETAVSLHDVTVVVDLLGVLVLRPSIWNLDLCVALLPSILQLLQSRYEAHMTAGCNSLRLILKNFASVIKTNIESPIQTVGVDISREERYNKSMECYKHLVAIRAFTLKRQTLQGKIGHAFRELHILLSNLD